MWPCCIETNFFIIKLDPLISQIYFVTKLYMFRTVRLSIIRSLFTVHSAMVDSFRAGPSWSCSKAVYKPVWHTLLLSAQWINSWWWTDELSEACRVSWQNKFVKLAHPVGFIIKKYVLSLRFQLNRNKTIHNQKTSEFQDVWSSNHNLDYVQVDA
jgi:hypothetical protein